MNTLAKKLVIIIGCTILWMSFSSANNPSSISISGYINEIHKSIADNYNNKNFYTQAPQVLKELCTNIYKANQKQIYYDAHQSIFMTIVCNSLAGGVKDEKLQEYIEKNTISSYLKRRNRQDLTLFCPKSQNTIQSNGNCIPEEWNNSIDYNYLFLKTVQTVLNDRGNVATVRLYGFEKIDEKNGDLANLYLATHFEAIGKIPEAKDYPKTYQELNKYIRNTKTIVDKLYIIDRKITKERKSDIENKYCLWNNLFFTINGKKTDNTSCLTKDYSDQTSYINALYNELFFYILFSSLYEQYIPIFLQEKSVNEPLAIRNFLTQIDKVSFVQQQSQQQRQQIITATQLTIKQLSNLQTTFPLHIGLLLYQEDLYDFRKRLAKAYLPFHQLHYKLENVQSKE